MTKKIIILSADPKSINSEIIYKSWNKLKKTTKEKICVITNYNLLQSQFKLLKYKVNLKILNSLNDSIDFNKINVLNLNLNFDKPFDISQKETSKFIKASLNYAHKLALKKNVAGIINCPINKTLLGSNGVGVTEYLAKANNIKNKSEVMFIFNKSVGVCPLTTHININKVSKNISAKIIKNKIITINKYYKKIFRKKPKIGVLGLNPHNSELKKNSEESKIILPEIKRLKRKRININGPLVSDTLFIKEYKNYDVIVGMYHDQVLAPFKALYKFNAINLTLGLKYLRVSPDHGTAVNLIKKNKADPSSLINCINFINKYN